MGHFKKSTSFSTELRVCPQCGMASYVHSDSPLLCRFCGYSSFERRREKRHMISALEFEIEVGGHLIHARLLDHSASGLKLTCPEGISPDEVLAININGLGIRKSAKAVWSRPLLRGITVTGLRFS